MHRTQSQAIEERHGFPGALRTLGGITRFTGKAVVVTGAGRGRTSQHAIE